MRKPLDLSSIESEKGLGVSLFLIVGEGRRVDIVYETVGHLAASAATSGFSSIESTTSLVTFANRRSQPLTNGFIHLFEFTDERSHSFPHRRRIWAIHRHIRRQLSQPSSAIPQSFIHNLMLKPYRFLAAHKQSPSSSLSSGTPCQSAPASYCLLIWKKAFVVDLSMRCSEPCKTR